MIRNENCNRYGNWKYQNQRESMSESTRLDTVHTNIITSCRRTPISKRGGWPPRNTSNYWCPCKEGTTTWNSEFTTELNMRIIMIRWEMAARRMALIEPRESRGIQISWVQSAIVHSLEKDNMSLLADMDIQGYVLILPYSLRNTYVMSDTVRFALSADTEARSHDDNRNQRYEYKNQWGNRWESTNKHRYEKSSTKHRLQKSREMTIPETEKTLLQTNSAPEILERLTLTATHQSCCRCQVHQEVNEIKNIYQQMIPSASGAYEWSRALKKVMTIINWHCRR
jgi:hypothetical protein